MPEVKIVGRGVDTLVLNVSYADKQFQPIKQELDADLQEDLNTLQGEARINESAVVTKWAFKGFNLFMKDKGSRGQWRWILTCPLVSRAVIGKDQVYLSRKCKPLSQATTEYIQSSLLEDDQLCESGYCFV